MKADIRERYDSEISKLRTSTQGKKVLLITHPSVQRPWMDELLDDLGIVVLKRRNLTVNRWIMGTEESEKSKPYLSEETVSDINEMEPDLVLSDSQSDMYIGHRVGIIGQPAAGLEGILDYARRLTMMFETPVAETWRMPL